MKYFTYFLTQNEYTFQRGGQLSRAADTYFLVGRIIFRSGRQFVCTTKISHSIKIETFEIELYDGIIEISNIVLNTIKQRTDNDNNIKISNQWWIWHLKDWQIYQRYDIEISQTTQTTISGQLPIDNISILFQ